MEKNRTLSIKLYPEVSNFTRENPPIASFIIRLVSSLGDRKTLIHPGKNVLNSSISYVFLLIFWCKIMFLGLKIFLFCFFLCCFYDICRSYRQANQD